MEDFTALVEHNKLLRSTIEEYRRHKSGGMGDIGVLEFERASAAAAVFFSYHQQEEVVAALNRYSGTLFQVQDAGIALYNRQESAFEPHHFSPDLLALFQVLEKKGAIDTAVEEAQPMLFAEMEEVRSTGTAIVAPLLLRSACIGILLIRSKEAKHDIEQLALRTLNLVCMSAAAVLHSLSISSKVASLEEKLSFLTQKLVLAAQQAAFSATALGIAEEIAAPLSVLKSNVELLSDGIGSPELQHNIIKNNVAEAESILVSLGMFAGNSGGAEVAEPVLLPELAEETVRLMRYRLQRESIRTELEYDEQIPPLFLKKKKIRQLILNVINNSREAMPRGGKITFSIFREGEENICLSIADSGTGMSAAVEKQAFEAFFTTKSRHIGLGLTFCRETAEEHGGRAIISSEEDKGTLFKLLLPQELGSAALS